MGFVTKEQATQARSVSVLDYIMRHESSNIKRVGSSYRLKDHDSLTVSHEGFYWHSQGFGGVTALDFLMKVREYDFVSAVCKIIGEPALEKGMRQSYQPKSYIPPANNSVGISEKTHNSHRNPLSLPMRNKNNYRVIAYLQNRGIDRDLIMDCINRGALYESPVHHNAVFLGKDEHGKTRFAAIRGTFGSFKCDAEGSDKKYGFAIPPENPASKAVAVFESPIDCLSHQTFCKNGCLPDFEGYRLSLGGTSLNALLHFLQHHPEVNYCLICTDSDEAGNKIATKITEEFPLNMERAPPPYGKDYNETLTHILQAERMKNKVLQQVEPCI